MEVKQCLQICLLLTEWELEAATAAAWRHEMRQCRSVLKSLLNGQQADSLQENDSMSHVILPTQKQNKDIAGSIARAEFEAGFNQALDEINRLIVQLGPKLNTKNAPGFDLLAHLESIKKGKTKEQPAQQAPLFADGRNGLGEALFSKEADSLSMGLARAAAKNKDKFFGGAK